MLTAAVCGDIFASPSVKAVLAAIMATSRPGGPGALLIVKNYTGDRLNFGLAAEQARGLGVAVELVFVGDDAAVHGGPITGRRGLAGTLLVHKCAGAVAASGAALGDVVAVAAAVAGRVRTVGASLTACSVPGQVPSGRLDAVGVVEVGLGIHGEPGLAQMPLPAATGLVEMLVGVLWGGASADGEGLAVTSGDGAAAVVVPAPMPLMPDAGSQGFALLVNDLGGCSGLELGVLAKAAVAAVSARGGTVTRLLVGPLMTALDMKGFSLTLLPLSASSSALPGLTELVDAPTSAGAWPAAAALSSCPASRGAPVPLAPELAAAGVSAGVRSGARRFGALPSASPAAGDGGAAAMLAVAAAAKAAGPLLTALDTLSGDGDCGLTAHKGAVAIEAVALASLLAAGRGAAAVAAVREAAARAGERAVLGLASQFEPEAPESPAAEPAAAPSTTGATAATEDAETTASGAVAAEGDGSPSDVAAAAAAAVAVCDTADAAAALGACGEAVSSSMGGSSGVLYTILLAAASRAASEAAAAGMAAPLTLSRALAAGTDAVSSLGGATEGCSTMVDALMPAARAAAEAAACDEASVASVAAAAASAAVLGARATAGMRAKAGRASYSQACAAVADPGAVTVAVLLTALANVVA